MAVAHWILCQLSCIVCTWLSSCTVYLTCGTSSLSAPPAGTRPWSSSCSPTPSWGSLCPRPWVSSVWWWLSSSCSPCKSLKPGLPHPHRLPPPFSSQSLSFLVSSFPPFLHPEGGFPEREPRMSWLAIPINRRKKNYSDNIYKNIRVRKALNPTFLCSRAYFCFAEVLCKTSLQLTESVQNKWLG